MLGLICKESEVDIINAAEVQTIEKYLDECLFEPEANWPPYWFEQRAYSRWAAKEIILGIKERSRSHMTVVQDFIRQMDEFAGIKEDTQPSFVFIIARDAAKEILCTLEAIKERKHT